MGILTHESGQSLRVRISEPGGASERRNEVQDDDRPERQTGLTRAEWLLLLVLAAVQFTHSMDFMVMMPLGPQCRQELGITPQQFALVVGAYGFSAALGGLLAAWFIDRFDRKAFNDFLLDQGLLPPGLLAKAVREEFVPAQKAK